MIPRPSRLGRPPLAAGLLLALLALTPLAWPAEPARVARRTLGCGLTLIFEKDASSPLTSLCLLIRGGQRAEPEGRAGLAFLTTRLLLEIPDSRSAQVLMQQASTAGMAVQGDFSLISIESLSSHFEETLRLMSGPLFDPLFTRIRLDNIKKSMLHRGKIAEDDPVLMGHAAQLRVVFEGSPYAVPALGSEESLEAITGKDASAFYRARFRTGNVVLAVISDLDEDTVSAAIDKNLKGFPAGPALPLDPLKPLAGVKGRSFLERQTNQTLISYGFRLPALTPRSYAQAALIENLLGKGSASRLWPLRQERLLAYNIGADVSPQGEAGLLEVYLETDEPKKGAAAAALREALFEVKTQGVGPEEFAALKAMTKTNFFRDSEAKDRRCSDLAVWEALGLGAEYLLRFPDEIDAVSAEEFQAFIRETLDLDRASIVVVGPKDLGSQDPSAPER